MLHKMHWLVLHDPTFPLLRLPWMVSAKVHLAGLLGTHIVHAKGLTCCLGSLGVRSDNDQPSLVERFGARSCLVRLRATKRTENPRNFREVAQLTSAMDVYAVGRPLVREKPRRAVARVKNTTLPPRPDHGRQLPDDLNTAKRTYPGCVALNTAGAAP